MNGPRFVWMMVWLLLSLVMIIPVACAPVDNIYIPPSTGARDTDNPELLSVLKTHTAYVCVTQQARMDGVINYIDRISDGTGTTTLRWLQDDCLGAASLDPSFIYF